MSKKLFCNELQPNTHIRTTAKNGEVKEWVIRRMIPMQSWDRENNCPKELHDIEILLDKSKNIYFSYSMYLIGDSWVKEIEILS